MKIIKTFENFVNQNFVDTNLTPFQDLMENDFVILYNRDEKKGYFKVLNISDKGSLDFGADTLVIQKYNSNGTYDPAIGRFVINREDIDYTFRKLEKVVISGIAVVYNQRILLVHKTGDPSENSYTYPKGRAKEGEKMSDTALREMKEEIGISLPKELLDKTGVIYEITDEEFKTHFYFIVKLTPQDFKKYFDILIIPKKNLQLEEVDFAGFLNKEESLNKISESFKKILDLL